MDRKPARLPGLLGYLLRNAVWWLVPLVLLLGALILFVLLTQEPAPTMPNIYRRF